MYRFNDTLIERTQDRSLFDPTAFRILRFNEAGFRLITRLKPSAFTSAQYLAAAGQVFPAQVEALAFLDRCTTHQVFLVEENPAAASQADR
ncbi:hypothetical protein PCO31111_01392 [Pandoraea communis]|uniref:Uncharacterized protein n=1 Tax=Pandoraea communis TaxID=2508297 RepID=A0A5E4TIL9_9BURK|nr:hypothetical protein [Pandoraea communis]VVD86328.1 hypothetical protein PCO31111_01392 [Pandoraea communis]